jgi:hypothetical protein
MNQEQALEKKQIKKHVIERIGRGEPKQQILEELSQLYKDKVTIVKHLEFTPSNAMKEKFKMHNYGLAVLLLGVLVLDFILLVQLLQSHWGGKVVIDFTTSLNVVLNAVFLAGVLSYRIEIYSWIASCAVVMLITITASLYYYEISELNPLLFISLALIIVSFVLGLLLGVKLCPQRVPKVIEVDIDGVEKINKTIYVFPD